jgi:D-tyrosyl-tRNA(Tyr) deacylase
VRSASVDIAGRRKSNIGQGLLILVGICDEDTDEDIDYLSRKIVNMRIFDDSEGVMNLPITEVPDGGILVVSQFTLMASTKKGNRPSYIHASRPEFAVPMYERFVLKLQTLFGKEIQTGEFGADMQVSLVNDGPVTIIMDSHQRERF